jgi:hypothetical protein
MTFRVLVFSWLIGVASTSLAQAPRDGTLIVTVVDQTRAVIPSATVTVTGLDDATKAATVPPATTSDVGVATVAGLKPGRYVIAAEFPGFQTAVLKDVRVRAGDNKHVIVLALETLQDSVTVGRDAQETAADRQSTFGSAFTREQVEALSDDPNEMARQLQEIAGSDAVLRVDSFEGARLPSKAQIKSIHITRDAFAAENHSAGGLFIDIITQPGTGPLRGGIRYNLRDGSFSGRSPFTPVKGPERFQNYGSNFSGSLIKERASFNVSFNGSTSYSTPNLYAATPSGTRSELTLRSPRDNFFMNGNFDYALTKDQTLRIGYNQEESHERNLGVGAFDLPEHAHTNEEHGRTLRIQEAGPLGRRFFTNTRLSFSMNDSNSRSALETPTIRVNDAFTSGGAQVAGGRHTRTFNLASDLDYVRSIHSVRTGIVLSGGSYRSDDTSNYLGTYTFESLAAYEAGTPRSYTRRIGDPNIRYWNLQAGAYIQDDIRIRKGLTLSPGLRYEAQTHLDDFNAFGPRFGITWAPFKSGTTTLRASAGVFYDWLNSGTYEQSLRIDGFRQQELNILNPSFPDPGGAGVIPPINKYLLADDLQMAKNSRVSVGVDQAFTPKVRGGVTYAHVNGSGLLRGLNENAPIGSARPNPLFGNIVEVVGDGSRRQNTVNAFLQVMVSPPSPNPSKQLWNWKRTNFGINYNWGSAAQQRRRRVQRTGDRQPRRRVGAGRRRPPPPPQRVFRHPGAAQFQRQPECLDVDRAAVHDSQRRGSQWRSDLQRPAARRGPQYRARRRPLRSLRVLCLHLHVRAPAHSAAPRDHDQRLAGRRFPGDPDAGRPAAAVPPRRGRQRPEPHQSHQLHRVPGQPDVAVFPPADQRLRHAKDRRRPQLQLLVEPG